MGVQGPRVLAGSKGQSPFAWLGREDSNLRMAESKSAALPLGDAPTARLPSTSAGARDQPPGSYVQLCPRLARRTITRASIGSIGRTNSKIHLARFSIVPAPSPSTSSSSR